MYKHNVQVKYNHFKFALVLLDLHATIYNYFYLH